jgi:hypothetical protein
MKKGTSNLRKELNDISYTESHPEVCEMFKDAGCYNFCKKLQSSHQQVEEAFALNFDGKKAIIGQDEFKIDEALIDEVIELPMTREKWFKTTITKNVEFKTYLKPEHRGLIWNKDIHVSFLEEKWQQLLKTIMVYVTCEGQYNKVMIYHFKLINNLTHINPLNLPYFLHRSLSKMAHQFKAKPNQVPSRLSHHSLIKLLVCELLQRRGKSGITSYSGMISRLRFSQREKRVLIPRSLPLPKVERGGGELSLQPQSINPLLPLSLEKLIRN